MYGINYTTFIFISVFSNQDQRPIAFAFKFENIKIIYSEKCVKNPESGEGAIKPESPGQNDTVVYRSRK